MKAKNAETKNFIREYFRVPEKYRSEWCIIEERIESSTYLRLGLAIKDTALYLDVARRRFFTAGCFGAVERKIYPSVRTRDRKTKTWIFTSRSGGLQLRIPNTYIADIYYTAVFHKGLLQDHLI